MCVGCVPPVLNQREKPSLNTFHRLLPWPHLTTAEICLLTSCLSDKHAIYAARG